MHFKDLATSSIRANTAHTHSNMFDFDLVWRWMASQKREGEPATEEVLILKADLIKARFKEKDFKKEIA